MKTSPFVSLLVFLSALVLVAAACNGDGGAELTTTSSLVTDPTDSSDTSTTSVSPDETSSTTSTTLAGEEVTNYEIAGRQPGDDGETLLIVVPEAAYTDVDLENFILDLVDSGTATFGAEVFGDPAAVDAYLTEEEIRTEAQAELLEQQHYVSLVNGNIIRFQGPFAESGEFVIGS